MSSEVGAHEQQCIRTWSLQIADCAPCSPVGAGAPEILSRIISDWLLASVSCAWPAGARSNVSLRPGCVELRKFAGNCAHNLFTGLPYWRSSVQMLLGSFLGSLTGGALTGGPPFRCSWDLFWDLFQSGRVAQNLVTANCSDQEASSFFVHLADSSKKSWYQVTVGG